MNTTRFRSLLILVALLPLVAACAQKPTSTPAPAPTNTVAVPTVFPTPAPGQTPPATQVAPTQPPAPPATLPTAPATPVPPAGAVAVVNGQAIMQQDYQAQVDQAMGYLKQQQGFDPNSQEGLASVAQLRRQVMSWMVDQALIEQAAAKEGVSVPDDQVEAEILSLVGNDPAKFEDWLYTNGLTRDSFKAQLRRELLGAALQERIIGSLSTTVEQAHARHILLPTESEAMNVLLKLRNGENFGELAKQYSQDKGSKDMGGDLGWFPRGVMPVEIEAVAFALAPGQISGIVKTDFGYHLIEVVERDPARQVPEDMLASWRQKTFQRWLEAQKNAAKILYLVSLE